MLIDRYKYGKYHTCSFHGGSNKYLSVIMCEDRIVILEILQSYVLHRQHAYLIHPGMYRTEAIICQNLYWPRIRNYVQNEVTKCDTFQGTK